VTASEITSDTPQTNGTEVYTSSTSNTDASTDNTDVPASSTRPVCNAARRGREQVKQWTTLLRGPPEDVMDSD